MALWQYTFYIIPKDGIEFLSNHYNFIKGEDGFEDEIYWKVNPRNKMFFRSIQDILPKNKSWSNEIDLYGNQDSDCLEVLFDNNDKILSASFRIDFRSKYEKVISRIIEFCILNSLVILTEDLAVVPLNSIQAQKIIEGSPKIKKYNNLSSNDRLE